MCDVFWWSTFPNQQTLGFIIGLLTQIPKNPESLYPPEVHPGHPHRKGRTLLFFINCCASRPKDFSSVLDNGSFWKVRCSTYSKPKFHVQKRNRLGRVKTRQKKGRWESCFFSDFIFLQFFDFKKSSRLSQQPKKKLQQLPSFLDILEIFDLLIISCWCKTLGKVCRFLGPTARTTTSTTSLALFGRCRDCLADGQGFGHAKAGEFLSSSQILQPGSDALGWCSKRGEIYLRWRNLEFSWGSVPPRSVGWFFVVEFVNDP